MKIVRWPRASAPTPLRRGLDPHRHRRTLPPARPPQPRHRRTRFQSLLVTHRGAPVRTGPRRQCARWSVEECFQAAKSQVGLDHYQGPNWTSWHRHITLAMLALAFLSALAASAASDRLHPARGRDPISLTVPEIRHLLAAVFNPPTVTAAGLLHWSSRRRRHQATARRSHYRRRTDWRDH